MNIQNWHAYIKMAPQSKREASPDQTSGEEVCKKLKEEAKVPAVKLDNEAQDAKDSTNDNANNNSTSKNETNGSNANKSGSGEVKAELKSETEQDSKEDKAEVNGAKTEEEPAKVEVSNGNSNKKQTSEPDSTTKASLEDSKTPKEKEPLVGTFLICGGANWDMTGRKELPKAAKKPTAVDPAARNLWGPHRVVLDGSDKALRVKGVFSGCNACHSVIVTDEGITMTFGRNDKGQLGVGDTETKTLPVVVNALKGIDVVAAACGRSHTLFLTSDGIVFACGDNKMGQCGTNQQSVQQITTPTRIAFKENKRIVKIACGAEFSMIVDSDGRLYSFGHPEHGQLGHNSEGKYFTSGNKYAFHCEYAPRRIVTYIEKSREGHVTPVDDVQIVDVACGTNHTLAVDRRHRCYSWGFAGYHRLGHSETKNELVPRSIRVFDAPSSSGRGASRVYAGATHSMALDMNGLLYFWGQNKSSGEATMYPKNVPDLCGWKINAVACANRSIFVIADDMCISWGPSPTYGELGYGEGKSKSSTTAQEVKTLDGIHAFEVACGFGHTMIIARDSKPEDLTALNTLKSWP